MLNLSAMSRLQDSLPTMANVSSSNEGSRSKSKKTIKHPCTPLCDSRAECPKHHDLVLTLISSNDCQGTKSNIIQFEKCVVKYIEEGWEKNDVVPDPSEDLRLPLIHLACAFGRCVALEWLLSYGFDQNVKSSTGQFALHSALSGLYRSRTKVSSSKLVPKLNRIITALPKQLAFHDEINGDTPLHTAVNKLKTLESKSHFFQACIEAIATQANKVDYPANSILDGRNYEGKTALHLLAGSCTRVEYCASAIRALINAGADKTIRDNNDETALDIAFAQGVPNIVHELLRNGEHLGFGFYSELDQDHEVNAALPTNLFPSPSPTDDSDTNWSERASSRSSITPVNSENTVSQPTVVWSGIKQESPSNDEEHGDSQKACDCDTDEPQTLSMIQYSSSPSPRVDNTEVISDTLGISTSSSPSTSSIGAAVNSPAVLKYLGDAGLLGDVSALVARARAQDEASIRKIESRASDIDSQIKKKEHSIEKMKQELSTLRMKRKECDTDFERLKKRMHSCESAMKELPTFLK